MNAKLTLEDAEALDLLLDRSPTASGHAAAVYAPSDGAGRDRVQCAERVLSLLHWMPIGDPPQDLLAKTLRHVDRSLDANGLVGAVLQAPSAHPHA